MLTPDDFGVDVDALLRGARRFSADADEVRSAHDLGVTTAPAGMGPADVMTAFDWFAAAWHEAGGENAETAAAIPDKLARTAQHYTDADSGANDGFQELLRRLDDGGSGPASGLPFRVPR